MSLPKAIIFDLDMTLVDSSALEEWRKARMWKQVMLSLRRVKPFDVTGSNSPHELPALLRGRGHRVAIVTSSKRDYATEVLKLFGIEHDGLIAYEDTEQHKPDPAPILAALEHLDVEPSDAIYVGDSPFDVEASYHAGVFSVGAGWGVQNVEAFSFAAPDALLMKPSTLLRLSTVERASYFAEVRARKLEPYPHAGSFLPCGGSPARYALGRYFMTEDPRHAISDLSRRLLQFKTNDDPAPVFARALASFIKRVGWTPDFVLSVPPKPSQSRDRFESLFAATQGLVGAEVNLATDGLRCVKEIEGYKRMGALERAKAIRGAFESKYVWENCSVLLVDDVLTTGETVAECARVLLADGAVEVRVVTIGKDQQVFARKSCAACTRPMRVRTNRDGVKFWGCSGYPDYCKNTEDL